MKAHCIADLIGHTPLLRLPLRLADRVLWLKLEKTNPGQSIKDRMAVAMVDAAVRAGQLRPAGTIVESSSGNTGTALAMLCAERGYRFIAVVDRHASPEKLRVMQAYGAELVRVGEDAEEDAVATLEREEKARQLGRTIPGAVYLNQPLNPANGEAYESTLARELIEDLGNELDTIVGPVGTGGSLSGTARGLRRTMPNVKVVAVEPEGSIIFGGKGGPYFQSGTGTPEGVEIANNVDFSVIDESVSIDDATAFSTARYLARNHGVLVGGSSGGVIYAALSLLASGRGRCVVALVADGGEKYLDTVFDAEWTLRKGLHSPDTERALAKWLAGHET